MYARPVHCWVCLILLDFPRLLLLVFLCLMSDLSKQLFESCVASSLLKGMDLHGLAACFMIAQHLPPRFLPPCALHFSEVLLYSAALWGHIAWSLKHLLSLLSPVIRILLELVLSTMIDKSILMKFTISISSALLSFLRAKVSLLLGLASWFFSVVAI